MATSHKEIECVDRPLSGNDQFAASPRKSKSDHVEKSLLAEDLRERAGRPPQVSILGVPVSAVNMDTAVRTILQWVEKRQAEFVCVREVFGLMCAVRDPEMMQIQRAAAMVTPDGMPLVWISRFRSKRKVGRVSGADFMDALCNAGQARGLRHYFYGGKPGVAEVTIQKLKSKFPNLCVVGSYSPPFRPLTDEEDSAIVAAIQDSGAQVVWVGIGTPKQDFWMRNHVGRIQGATLIGVGAAFDFQSGTVQRAPKWMQKSSLEWLHRLASEPRRLWYRYLVVSPLFMVKVFQEQILLFLRG